MTDDTTPRQASTDSGSLIASWIPAFARVLDVRAGDDASLRDALPDGCLYRACAPDALESVDVAWADMVTLLGGVEGGDAPLPLLRAIRALNRPLICTYPTASRAPDGDQAPGGQRGPVDFAGLRALMAQAGFRLDRHMRLNETQDLFLWAIDNALPRPPVRARKVLVLSYFNTPNFGDRLGYHIVNGLLPANALVTHLPFKPWSVPAEDYDMVILGIGNSINAPALGRPELHQLLDRTPHAIGIFGTQYRYQYETMMDPALFGALLDKLTTWWARYEEDILAYGRGRDNVRHMGDWLISAFPMATPTLDKTLTIPAKMHDQEMPLDRAIQQIQRYRRVSSARIHPMLCALTSAQEIAYHEQRETGRQDQVSGKFRSQLYDIFGRTFEEGQFFKVDRQAVARYKMMVEANIATLRAQIADLLGNDG